MNLNGPEMMVAGVAIMAALIAINGRRKKRGPVFRKERDIGP